MAGRDSESAKLVRGQPKRSVVVRGKDRRGRAEKERLLGRLAESGGRTLS